MKTFIVYDLDSGLPVWVGEQTSEETARYTAGDKSPYNPLNLVAQEIGDELIEKNSLPNPDIALQQQNYKIAEEVFGVRPEELRQAERYSRFIYKKLHDSPEKRLPTFDEWRKDDTAHKIG